MKLVRASFYNNPFIGLYLRASDELFLCPPTSQPKLLSLATEALGLEPLKLFVDNSPLLGVFVAANSSGAVLPSFAGRDEIRKLKAAGVNVCLLDNLAPGNNVLANDFGALASERVPKEKLRELGDVLGVEVHRQRFATSIPPTAAVTNKGLYAYNELSATELKRLESIFKVRGLNGTSNMGVHFNSLGVVANSNGGLVGSLTSGFEVQKIYEALSGDGG